MDLPKDPNMLLSFVNTKLRDDFANIDKFCTNYNISKDELNNKLNILGYFYNDKENQFK